MLTLTLGVLLAVTPTLVAPARASDDRPPNVVLIILDTTRGDRVSFARSGRETTPHIAALARDAVVYRNAHSVSPWTLPSHASMLTGLLPGEHGATWRSFDGPKDVSLSELLARTFRLTDADHLLAEQLRERGYQTVGISSNAWISRRTGFDHGFQHFYELWKEEDRYRSEFRWIPPKLRSSGYLPTEIAALSEFDVGDAGQVLRVFDAHTRAHPLDAPFFLFFNFIDPHFPYSPPPSWRYAYAEDRELGERIVRFEFDELAMEAGARPVDPSRFSPFYDAELLYVDTAVGRLIEWLRERNLYDTTMIIVASDHGEHLGEGGHFSHQFSMAEELLQVPLLIKYPHSAEGGRIVDDPLVSNLDIYETVLSAVRGPSPTPPSGAVPSRDLRGIQGTARPYLIAEYYHSLPFLESSKRMEQSFDLEAHRLDRRVVYRGAHRYEFVQRPSGPLEPRTEGDGATEVAERDAALRILQSYVSGLGRPKLIPTSGEHDAETLERLRSLGYVE